MYLETRNDHSSKLLSMISIFNVVKRRMFFKRKIRSSKLVFSVILPIFQRHTSYKYQYFTKAIYGRLIKQPITNPMVLMHHAWQEMA